MVLAKAFDYMIGYTKDSAGKSCIDIVEVSPGASDGSYWIRNALSSPTKVQIESEYEE